MLDAALATPLRGTRAAETAVVGSVLLVASAVAVGLWAAVTAVSPRLWPLFLPALVPFLLVRGYGVRVVAAGVRGAEGAPTFSRPGALCRDGLKSAALSLVLLAPLWVAVGVGGATAAALRFGLVDAAGLARVSSASVTGFTGVVALGWLACYGYLRPAALACFAESGRLRDGLHPGAVARVALDGDYAKGWALGSLVSATGVVVAAPFVPLVVGVPLLFGVLVAANSLYGRGASRALRDDSPPTTSDPEPARNSGSITVAEPLAAAGGTDPPGTEAVLDTPEPDPAVQTGRRVPLTATDILSERVGGDGDGEADADDPASFAGDAADSAAGVDEAGELRDEPADPAADAHTERSDPAETDFAWGPTESIDGESGDTGGDDVAGDEARETPDG